MKFLLVLLALLAVAFSSQHLDNTVVTVADEIDAVSEHFLISIDHVEDLVGESGQILAERDIRVALRFDVSRDSYLVNGIPVELGYSELSLMAQVMEIEASGQPRPFDAVVKIAVRVFVGLRQVELDDGTLVDGIYMQERVVGVQENEFWQAEVVEQVFVFRKDGTVARQAVIQVAVLQGETSTELVDPVPETMEKPHHGNHHGHGQGHGHGYGRPHHGNGGHHGNQGSDTPASDAPASVPEGELPQEVSWLEQEKEQFETELEQIMAQAKVYYDQVVEWYYSLPHYQRILVSFSFGVLISVVAICFLKCLARCCCRKKKSCKSCQSCQSCQAPAPAANNYKENIRVYSLQYTAVPQDEKDAKKVEGSVEMV